MRGINKLSATKVANLKDVGRYADGGGLYLQVSDVGGHLTKAWLFRYMIDGRARAMGLGATHTFSLAEARERARKMRQLVSDGIDPIEHRLAERDARRADEASRITFKEAAGKYIATHADTWTSAKHRREWQASLEQYAFGTIGDRPVSAVDGALITHTLAPIWLKIPVTAGRVKQRIERVCEWVKNGMPLPAPSATKRVKHLAALPWTEVPAFMAKLRASDGQAARALEFLVLTAARSGEALGATWDEIDLRAKVWAIPADRMKGKRGQRVPLSDRAIEVLKALPREGGNPHLFVGAKVGQPMSHGRMREHMRAMDFNGATVHGFRSAFRDWASERTSYSNHVVEQALAHAIGNKVEAAYRRGDLFEKRVRLMADWARYCGEKPRAGAGDNVTSIRVGA